MKISIITVCYNSEKYIRSAIESVLNQTYKDIEYIVVDGGSKDTTLNIVKAYEPLFGGRMHWISEPDQGLYDAMNKGIKMSGGDVIGMLNSDDLFVNAEVIEEVISAFNNADDIEAVYADLYYVSQADTSTIARKWITGIQKPFRTGWHPAHPTLYIKKDVYDKYGLFNLRYKLASDFEIMLRFIDRYKIKMIYLNEVLVSMRLGGTTNKSISNVFFQNIEILRAFRENKISVNYLTYSFKRMISKVWQYKK